MSADLEVETDLTSYDIGQDFKNLVQFCTRITGYFYLGIELTSMFLRPFPEVTLGDFGYPASKP
jgi:hypothetical protein